ncbi:Type 1 glutamine amidotransferase-like domain-containing protein [Liquorilactobacillus capillatus]|uniref:Peptidase E n=1 Tax=Liquorilactobacillus capillatus DSM 19910 TaxID=1423731 RepID=A0A0R1LZL1_9LACO|nr:Type 1 glutamine amidotransferase-like domain-containing protein [Liquorilactobacillus capillatus]KRL01158.1 hypothetical protein FC81_GL001298 [Liquorilactobacillus capillatus DSM 19910]
MENILLSSRAFINKKITQGFLSLLGNTNFDSDQLVIIVNSVREGKKHPQMIELQQTVKLLGFKKVILFDVLSDDPVILKTAKGIILNGGYEFLLLDSLKKSGLIDFLKSLAVQGKPFYGISAGAIVLGPDLDLYNVIYPEDNFNNTSELTAINATDIRIYPHYDKHIEINQQLETTIKYFEKQTKTEVTRLDNEQAILIKNNCLQLLTAIN